MALVGVAVPLLGMPAVEAGAVTVPPPARRIAELAGGDDIRPLDEAGAAAVLPTLVPPACTAKAGRAPTSKAAPKTAVMAQTTLMAISDKGAWLVTDTDCSFVFEAVGTIQSSIGAARSRSTGCFSSNGHRQLKRGEAMVTVRVGETSRYRRTGRQAVRLHQ